MKRIVLSLIIVFAAGRALSQPSITNLSYPTSVNLFDLYEISFKMGDYINPYDPDTIMVYAVFSGPGGVCDTVHGFYFEGYTFQKVNGYEVATRDTSPNATGWRIRFTPTETGIWYFSIRATDKDGTTVLSNSKPTQEYSFHCLAVNNASGFISKANTRYLKRDVVENGNRHSHSFFPIGPNIAWYECIDYDTFAKPYGIYDYKRYIDSLDGRANFMRVWLNRYQYLSLYGPEYTEITPGGGPAVYFNNTVNQKDSAELDTIIDYACRHGVTVMACVFNKGDFKEMNELENNDPNIWAHNPFNTLLGLGRPCEFFTDAEAKAITKNLLRYIVSRWGYAANIMAWEFWNEVDQLISICSDNKHFEQDVLEWHEEMMNYLKTIDPYHHIVTTSMAGSDNHPYLYASLYGQLDLVQIHRYVNVQNAEIQYLAPHRLFKRVTADHIQYPSKLCFVGEFGFSQGNTTHIAKDPFGINLHNSIWPSLFFSTVGAASFWWWPYVDTQGLFKHFEPLLSFCQNLPTPSGSFTAHHTGSIEGNQLVFTNGLQTYYIMNADQDTIYGWSQDTAFAYSSLRRLTDSIVLDSTYEVPRFCFKDNAVFDPSGYVYTLNPSKKPGPSSNSNKITLHITNQPVGSHYLVRWYDSETGAPLNLGAVYYAQVRQDSPGDKYVSFQFPSLIRDLQNQSVNNKYGDAVFILVPAAPPLDKNQTTH